MKITTRYNTGDKVYFYIKDINKYTWGKVVSMDISVRVGRVDQIVYNIDNRFYDSVAMRIGYGSYWKCERYLAYEESEVFDDVAQLRQALRLEFTDKMDAMNELKKGWLS